MPPFMAKKWFRLSNGLDFSATFASFGEQNRALVHANRQSRGDAKRADGLLNVRCMSEPKLNPKPKCIIVTGRRGSGKTTLAKRLGELLWMPVVTVTRSRKATSTPSALGTTSFRRTATVSSRSSSCLVDQYLKGNISIVIEAAFQHHVWEPRMAKLLESASVWLVLAVNKATAGDR